MLRQLGATEFGSKPGCSIVATKQRLKHSACSQITDRYVKPVSPEDREMVEWVRDGCTRGQAETVGTKSERQLPKTGSFEIANPADHGNAMQAKHFWRTPR